MRNDFDDMRQELDSMVDSMSRSKTVKKFKVWAIFAAVINLIVITAVLGGAFYLVKYAIDAFAK